EIDLDDEEQVPFDDPATFHMISQARTLGVFQIESPGQRELVGKSGIETFEHIITDISLFRPGPVKSDMITPYLEAKHGWSEATYLHDDLRPILRETNGVVVFHEQVIEMIARFGGLTNAEADEKRRALGDVEGMAETKLWFFPAALGHGYSLPVVEAVWKVIEAFASFGFCKAHAAAFALPTYQSAWLKAHWPAHFLAGVLTHDPGMYPKRLILEDARQCGIAILGLDVNASQKEYVVERLSSLDALRDASSPSRRAPSSPSSGHRLGSSGTAVLPIVLGQMSRPDPSEGGWPDGRAWGIRLALAEVKGVNAGEVERIVAARPYHSLTDFWHRAQVSRPIVERLVLAGAFDSVYGLGSTVGTTGGVRRRTKVTRRDLLLQVAELDRHARAVQRAGRARGLAAGRLRKGGTTPRPADLRVEEAAARTSTDPGARAGSVPLERHPLGTQGVWAKAAAQSRAAADPRPVESVQLTLDLGDEPQERVSGLPEMTAEEQMRAELEILGLDASRHVVDTYADFLDALGAVRSQDLLRQRSKSEILVAGVKVATQTPPVRSGRRVVFLTLDDGTGPVDATFFEDAQGPYAATVFDSWLLVVRGEVRRTGHRGISLRATGAWPLTELHARWQREGVDAVRAHLAVVPEFEEVTRHRVLTHSSGFQMSPYADVKPAGESVKRVPHQPWVGEARDEPSRKLWHRSPGSPG
ncbi:MAG TPA: OB-fold nucleic acid binding domain-containing protein, partial [Nocardioides sp.]|nr:OB-fold nucleic acid binding domain-containing protein [Nocardioides sp.]